MTLLKDYTDKLALQIATLFGTGYLRGFPGTVGSLLGLIFFVAVGIGTGEIVQWLLFPGVLVIAFWSGRVTSQRLQEKDPACVVIDEVAGIWLAFLGTKAQGPLLLVGFFLFRLFDVYKPFPIRKLERIPGGWGILLDDLAAGLYANLLLRIIHNLINFN